MASRRDRHQRGVRGPLALPNSLTGRPVPVPRRPTDAEFFVTAVARSVRRIQQTCPDALMGVDIGVDEVPVPTLGWGNFALTDSVPLAAALESDADHPSRIVIFRRPLERRATDREDLLHLVHLTLVEQLSVLTARSVLEIDPDIDPDEW